MRQRHGRASDIFALGCVFCDMLSVLTDRTVSSFHEFLLEDVVDSEKGDTPHRNNRGPLYYSHKTGLIQKWFSMSEFHQSILTPMLASDRDSRPSAPTLSQALVALEAYENCEFLDNVLVEELVKQPG
jgi:serine/threonine protein kinase